MDPLTLGLIGGGIGLLKGQGDEARAKQQNLLNAQLMRYSPWTHMAPSMAQTHGDPTGQALQYGVTGAMLGQSINKADGGASSPEGSEDAYNPTIYDSFDPSTGIGTPHQVNQDMYQPGGEFYKPKSNLGGFNTSGWMGRTA
jgi:hypothetical protein